MIPCLIVSQVRTPKIWQGIIFHPRKVQAYPFREIATMTDISQPMVQPGELKDGSSVGSGHTGSTNTQTGFSFYNAGDFAPQKPPEEVQTAPSPKHPEDTSGSAGGSRDSVEILRSLQEHEQQRLEILGGKSKTPEAAETTTPSFRVDITNAAGAGSEASNPYEDAIKEALDLLRKHRPTSSQANTPSAANMNYASTTPRLSTKSQQQWFDDLIAGSRTPPQADPILQSREEAFSPDLTKPKTQTEGEPTTPSAVALGEAYQAEIEARRKQRQERMARYATRLAELKQDDRYAANGGNDIGHPSWGSPRSLDPNAAWRPRQAEPGISEEVVPASTSNVSKEDEVQRGVEKVLLAILERAHSHGRGERVENQPNLPLSVEHPATSEEKKASSPEPSAEGADDGNAIVRAMSDLLGGPSTSTLGSSSPTRDAIAKAEAAIAAGNKKYNLTVDTGYKPGSNSAEQPAGDDIDQMVRSVLIQDTAETNDHDNDSLDEKVRSVLSPQPSAEEGESDIKSVETEENTGDGNSYDDDDDDAFESQEDLDGVLGPLSKKAGGTTGVVLEADSPVPPLKKETNVAGFLDSLSSALSSLANPFGSSDNSETDRYALSEIDDETNELMRTLCAHLLPEPAKQSSLIPNRPDWDESNPDEAGYRIIRLNTDQLDSVEYAYERLMSLLRKDGFDDTFERDLHAAESLLNDEQKHNAKIEFKNKIYKEDLPLDGFPGVKSTGRGEMGDLEYFNLPIIFKSHVTGFEPTKDLVLESGNVVAGQYLVEGELGSAAFSTAYKCVDLSSEGNGPDGHEEVCLKVIKNTKDFFDQSLDEIKILELLRQTGMCEEKNLVEMKTFFYHREHLVIVTELLRQNLFEFGKFIVDSDEEPYFTMTRLCYITRQILISMDFIHKLGLVHSDIKPENILLSSYSRARVKVIDFGSSCFLTDRQSSYIQSRSYRAPEVVLGLPYDGRIDIWSLGCVVAEMYTGEVTFQNDSLVSMLSRIEAICGAFPSHMILNGRQSGRFFTRCGLLYEKLEGDDSSHSGGSDEDSAAERKRFVDIFQPKDTTLSSRLGFAPDLLTRYDSGVKLSKEETRQAIFVDFVRQLLIVDPDRRPTAEQALKHPWMKHAASLSEDEIKYPST